MNTHLRFPLFVIVHFLSSGTPTTLRKWITSHACSCKCGRRWANYLNCVGRRKAREKIFSRSQRTLVRSYWAWSRRTGFKPGINKILTRATQCASVSKRTFSSPCMFGTRYFFLARTIPLLLLLLVTRDFYFFLFPFFGNLSRFNKSSCKVMDTNVLQCSRTKKKMISCHNFVWEEHNTKSYQHFFRATTLCFDT